MTKQSASFTKKVYEVVKSIPFGETRSYQWIAEKAGKRKAARSIGQILKKNPYPLVIPCHRVIKKDGSKENFDREKIKRGLIKATWKRPVTMTEINELVDEVEKRLRAKDTREIKSWQIGNLVINRLRKIDKLGYLLFATVYRDFDSLEDFELELERIKSE